MTHPNRYKIIVNPTSGRGNGARIIPKLEQYLQTLGIDFDLVQTERPLHAIELAQQAERMGLALSLASAVTAPPTKSSTG